MIRGAKALNSKKMDAARLSPSVSHLRVPPPDSSALSSCHNRVYQSLANLIRWADQVMLDGIDLEDKENVASVTSVIKAVLDGVKVRLRLSSPLRGGGVAPMWAPGRPQGVRLIKK